MASFTRGQGDGEEQLGQGAGQAPAARNPPGQVDMDSPVAKDIVQSLVGMGISQTDAELAVRQTGADSAEAAIAWVFENSNRDEMLDVAGGSIYQQEYKMVFVVNASLPMTPGKMAAQVGHAAIALYQDLISIQDQYGGPILQWNENGAKKIVLRADNVAQLVDIATTATKAGLPNQAIEDAGLTQIPAGSQTVLAIFGVVSDVDKVTGSLKIF